MSGLEVAKQVCELRTMNIFTSQFSLCLRTSNQHTPIELISPLVLDCSCFHFCPFLSKPISTTPYPLVSLPLPCLSFSMLTRSPAAEKLHSKPVNPPNSQRSAHRRIAALHKPSQEPTVTRVNLVKQLTHPQNVFRGDARPQ